MWWGLCSSGTIREPHHPQTCFSVSWRLDFLLPSRKLWCWEAWAAPGIRFGASPQACKCVRARAEISPARHWLQDSFRAAVTCSGTVGKSLMFGFLSPTTWDCQQQFSALHLPLRGSWTELECLSPFWDICSQADERNEGARDAEQRTVGSE